MQEKQKLNLGGLEEGTRMSEEGQSLLGDIEQGLSVTGTRKGGVTVWAKRKMCAKLEEGGSVEGVGTGRLQL